jgi:tetratricopeptide (TPR) repeat protein
LALNPESTQAWVGYGNVLRKFGHAESALAAYDKALALKSDLANAMLGCANALYDLKRYDEASLTQRSQVLGSAPGPLDSARACFKKTGSVAGFGPG